MASVIREIIIDALPEKVWSVVGDFANGPMQFAPGIIVKCHLDKPDVRTFTLADGTVIQERLIARDEKARRIVWGWANDEAVHDNGSIQVFAEGNSKSRLVWIHDILPDRLADMIASAMDQQAPVFQQSMKSK